MDIILVGLPGSGKSVVGKRLAAKHRATFIDIDEQIEQRDGRPIPTIFAEDGESAFRTLERHAVADLGPADPDPGVKRIVATGGGAVVDPRNRWSLYRGRMTVWLDSRPEVLAQRLRRSVHVRPLITGRDPIGTIRDLGTRRERFYAAADIRVSGVAEVATVVDAVEARRRAWSAIGAHPTTLVRTTTQLGRLVIGDGNAAGSVREALDRLEARRAIVVSEPGAWAAVGTALAEALAEDGRSVETVFLPQGEAAKRLSAIAVAASELARLHVARDEAIVAVGGGALGDAAGFLAATFLRGITIIHVPTTLVAQIDSAIGGKTGIDLPEGKNLVGAFHQPSDIVIDVAMLVTLPERQRRAALGEAAKMAILGDERLFELLERHGDEIARGDAASAARGEVAELVERCALRKLDVVLADERERDAGAGRVTLNLGHSLGHAVEAAAGFEALLHGEAVAYGLRAACRIGTAIGAMPRERAERVDRLLDGLGLAREPLPFDLAGVLAHLETDKKHAAGLMRWVVPTADGVEIRTDVPDDVVLDAAGSLLTAGTTR
jgi:3-dehydroquinate synthetase/shikimate kinase